VSVMYKVRKRLVAIEYQQYLNIRQLSIHAWASPFLHLFSHKLINLTHYQSTCLRECTLPSREPPTALTSISRNKMPQRETSATTDHVKQPSLQHIGYIYHDKKATSACQDDMADELRRLSCYVHQEKNNTQQHGQWHAVDRSREVGDTRPWHGVVSVGRDRQTRLEHASGKARPGSKKGSSVATERGSV